MIKSIGFTEKKAGKQKRSLLHIPSSREVRKLIIQIAEAIQEF